jgi:N-methylhydantoinase B
MTASQPWGLLGGLPGAPTRVLLGDGGPMPGTKTVLGDGEAVSILTAGSGGYGPPAVRDPTLVQRDLAEERISEATAREALCVHFGQ